jgi:hypothetical protein
MLGSRSHTIGAYTNQEHSAVTYRPLNIDTYINSNLTPWQDGALLRAASSGPLEALQDECRLKEGYMMSTLH